MKVGQIIVATACLLGCATGYHSAGFSGGYSETQLDTNVFEVSFSGNGYTSAERARDFALLRSAELARTHGFRYFVIVNAHAGVERSYYTTPTQTTTTGTVTNYGGTASVQATSVTTGGQAYAISKPGVSNTIVCFESRPQGTSSMVYDADFVYRSIAAKYGLDEPRQPEAQAIKEGGACSSTPDCPSGLLCDNGRCGKP